MRADGRGKWLWYGTLALCVVVALFFGQKREWHNLAMYGMIHADAQGYYGYLVAGLHRAFVRLGTGYIELCRCLFRWHWRSGLSP
jgi:hypothetical protein